MDLKKPESVEQLLMFGFGAAMLVLLLVGGFAWNVVVPKATVMSVDHSREVMAEFAGLRSRMDQAENGQLAYFLNRDHGDLVRRDAALSDLQAIFERLRASTADNPLQQERLDKIQASVNQRISLLNENQAVFDSQGVVAAQRLLLVGREVASTLHGLLQDADAMEQSLLEYRQEGELIRLRIIAACIVLLLIFLVLLAVLLRRAMLTRSSAEKFLIESRQPLLKVVALQDAIFNSANFSSIATDADGVIQIFNVGAERMLGYRASEVVDKITPAGISDSQEVIVRAAALSLELGTQITPGFEALVFKASRGIEDIYELTYIRKDGSRFPAIVSVTALRDAEGAVIGYLLIGTDNTARKRVEAEQAVLDQLLRDQQFYTRSLIESNIDAIMTTDPRGIIGDVNQQMEALTSCTRDELIGSPFKLYFTNPDQADAGVTRVLREGKITNYELTARARDGKETVVSFNATTYYDRDRNLQGVFAAARDVTELKKFEHALQENNLELEAARAVAEKANLAKSEFLSSMSHELRSPLNAVLGFAQLMASSKPPPTRDQRRSIDQILTAGWYLLGLINEILDLSMIEAGKVAMSHEAVGLTDVLNDCRAMIEPEAQKRGIRMSFPDIDNKFYIDADRTRIKQVIINLMTNALKYNRAEGEMIVECALHGDTRVRMSFRDTGAGLTPEQLEQLFQPFNRLGQESGDEVGTGIGLVVTKRLVELMGGTIGVASDVGIGSVFWVEFVATTRPILASDGIAPLGAALQHGAALPVASKQRTVLYVEDNPANLMLVQELIERRSDLKLLTAIDAYQGIQLARTYLPAVILMDINLPGMSGYGALAMLRQDPATAHIPVLALSANVIPRDIERGLEAGFFRYLTKPIEIDAFMGAIDVALKFAAEHGLDRAKMPA